MCSNAKLLLVALCGALISGNLISNAAGAETKAYRGAGLNNAPGLVQQQQQQQQQAASAAQPVAVQPTAAQAAQAVLAQAQAFRDKPSLKDYYYGKKTDEYTATGAAYGNPGYNSQYPNPSQGYAAPQQQPQAMGAANPAFYGQQPQQQQPQMPQYPPQYGYPQQPQPQPYPQQPYQQPYPDQGYYPQPAPAPGPYYPPKPARQPYYPPKPHPYYPKPPPPAPMGVCQSKVFGAFYTQSYEDVISPDHELTGSVSAFMGCRDRTTLGGMCSYTCYDGEYYERFVGQTTKIATMPPQDWDNVDDWDHPVFCQWELGNILEEAPAMKAPNGTRQTGTEFSFICDFTIKAICCDDIVPHVPYGGDVDLGGGGECPDGGCGGGGELPCDPLDPECPPAQGCDGPDCEDAKGSKNTAKKPAGGTKKKLPTGGLDQRVSSRKRPAKKAGTAADSGASFTSIGNAKVSGGIRTPKTAHVSSLQAQSTTEAQPAMLDQKAATPATATKTDKVSVQLLSNVDTAAAEESSSSSSSSESL